MVDAEGLSCSNYIQATNRFLPYKGSTSVNTTSYVNLYLFPNPYNNVANDTPAVIDTYFNGSGFAKDTTLAAATTAGIDFISSFTVVTNFTYQQAKNTTEPIQKASLSGSFTVDYDASGPTATVYLRNVELDNDGSIYVTLSSYADIVPDPDDDYGTLDVPIKTPQSSSTDQIYRCLTWENNTADGCAKGAYTKGQPVTIIISNIPKNQVYYISYAVANEYPIEGIFTSSVGYTSVRVVGAEITRVSLLLLFIVMTYLLYV